MSERKQTSNFYWILIVTGIISILFIGLYFWKFHNAFSSEQSVWGAFGDYLSGVFQFITVGGLLLTIYIQNETLRTTKEELKESTKTLNSQVQESRQKLQTDIFIHLLRDFNETKQKFNYPTVGNGNYDFQSFLQVFINDKCLGWYKSSSNLDLQQKDRQRNLQEERDFLFHIDFLSTPDLNELLKIYDYPNKLNCLLNHLSFIEHNNKSTENKETLISYFSAILRNHLSTEEKITLLYTIIFPENMDHFLRSIKTLLIKYKLIEMDTLEKQKLFSYKYESVDNDFHAHILEELNQSN